MSTVPPDAAGPSTSVRVRPLAETPPLLERAARMLARPAAVVPFTEAEASQVAARMGLVMFPAGAQIIREGSDTHSSHLLVLLQGEVSIDTGAGASSEAVPLSVLGPGDIIGEMALLDGAPRSASCTAVSAVHAAALTRTGLAQLMTDQPAIAAKLLMVLASRIAERLRALGHQLQMYADLSARQEAELRRLRGPARG